MQKEESAIRVQASLDGVTHFATGIAVFENDKLLVVRRVMKDDFLGGEWELPGGGVDEGETFEQGAIRELLEETGLQTDQIVGTFEGFDYTTPKKPKVRQLNFKVTVKNIPSALISDEAWKRFMHLVAEQTNLYKYPTTDVWPFILPATQEEYETDITHFPIGREPKFELVYDTYSPVPTIQIDIETDLTRPQVEQLFPEPYGISFPDLADFFRTVYIHHEWLGLAIRFDIRFKSDQPGVWETGKWLVNDGGRTMPPENFTEAVKIMANTPPVSNDELKRHKN